MREAQKKTKTFKELTSLGLQFSTDLNDFVFPHFDYYYTMFDKYDNFGVLPYSGAHSEQPSLVLEIFQILSSLKIEENNRQIEKTRKK